MIDSYAEHVGKPRPCQCDITLYAGPPHPLTTKKLAVEIRSLLDATWHSTPIDHSVVDQSVMFHDLFNVGFAALHAYGRLVFTKDYRLAMAMK